MTFPGISWFTYEDLPYAADLGEEEVQRAIDRLRQPTSTVELAEVIPPDVARKRAVPRLAGSTARQGHGAGDHDGRAHPLDRSRAT
jgi:hypothetical protein